ncbi:MAG TPA: hypothetical protein VLR26_01370 [Frankiaceae bacterium]|nr:hypothetical protein [Frankiaceae bacterium]
MTSLLPRRPSPHLPSDGTAPVGLFGPVTQLSAFARELAELPLGPRGAFREQLRATLVAEAAHRLGEAGASRPTASDVADARHRRSKHARRAAAAGLAVALVGGGVAAASAGSLPGAPLYPIKKFEQSVRVALDPTSGVGPAVQLVSARVTEAERTVSADPGGTDIERWDALDTSLAGADRTLVQLMGSAPPAELSSSLSPVRERVQRLLSTVPEAHRPVVQQLLDTIDGLFPAPAEPSDSTGRPVFGLLPPVGLTPAGALAQGWPLDPAGPAFSTPAPPLLPGLPGSTSGPGIAGNTGSPPAPGSSGSAGVDIGSGGSGSGGTSPSGLPVLPGVPVGPGDFSPGPVSTTSRGPGAGVPQITGTLRELINGTVSSTTGGRSSSHVSAGQTPTAGGPGGGGAGGVVGAVGDAVGDATDSLGGLPRLGPVPSRPTAR